MGFSCDNGGMLRGIDGWAWKGLKGRIAKWSMRWRSEDWYRRRELIEYFDIKGGGCVNIGELSIGIRKNSIKKRL